MVGFGLKHRQGASRRPAQRVEARRWPGATLSVGATARQSGIESPTRTSSSRPHPPSSKEPSCLSLDLKGHNEHGP